MTASCVTNPRAGSAVRIDYNLWTMDVDRYATYGVMGVTFVIGIVYVVVNLFVDLLYGWLDPRIHYS